MSEDTRYGFTNGRVRALETLLLDRGRYDRLIRTGSRVELRTALVDTSYGRYLSGEGTALDLEQTFSLAAADNFSFLARYCLDDWLLTLFRLGQKLCGVKSELKELVSKTRGSPDPRHEQQVRNEEQKGLFPAADALLAARFPWAQKLIGAVLADYREAEVWQDPTVIDFVLDRLEQKMALMLVRPSLFLTDLYSLHADIENLIAFVRVRAHEKEPRILRQAFLPGGSIPLSCLAGLLSEDWDAVTARFRLTPYRRFVQDGISQVVAHGSLLRIEQLGREMQLQHLRQARYVTFGYEPLVAYYLFRENEFTNLRQLSAAKRAGMAQAECQHLIAYVA